MIKNGPEFIPLGGFAVEMNRDVVNNVRSIYNALDYLGDIGGLLDMLRLLGGGYLSFFVMIVGDSLKLSIFKGLFVIDDGNSGVSKQSDLQSIKLRRPFKTNQFQCSKHR